MKFVQFRYNHDPDEIHVGYMENEDVVDINKYNPGMPKTMYEILKTGCTCNVVKVKHLDPLVEPKASVTLVAPITGMDKILGVDRNYIDFCDEKKVEVPSQPVIYTKFPSNIIGPNESIKIKTDVTKEVDWEVHLAVIIGQTCSDVSASDALKYVFGYTVGQSICSRDWEKKNPGELFYGKAQDTFCPLGPWIVTCDEIKDPHNVKITCSVNGVEKQNSHTSRIIYKVPDIIQKLSSIITLLPGDVILTGTPAGVGVNLNPQEFLKPGDVVRSEIEKIGSFNVMVTKC